MGIDYNKVFLITFIILSNTLSSQECDSGYVWIEDVPTCCVAPAQNCFYETDLNIIQEIIDNSAESINMLLDNVQVLQVLDLNLLEMVSIFPMPLLVYFAGEVTEFLQMV